MLGVLVEVEEEEEEVVEGVRLVRRGDPVSPSVAGRSVVASGLTGLGSSREISAESAGFSLGRSEENKSLKQHFTLSNSNPQQTQRRLD